MSFKLLYEFAQGLNPSVSRATIRQKALELTGLTQIRHVKTEMDLNVCRGMFLAPQNNSSKIVQQLGNHVIVTARGLNYCWERFVYIKELMHIFGDISEAADTGEKFEALLNDFLAPSDEISPQMRSELHSFWMALSVICPEKIRREYANKRANSEIDDYTIALNLRIPQQYVPRLFESRYSPIVQNLVS